MNYFTLREQLPLPAKDKTERNKKKYKIKNNMMNDGDGKLRDILTKDVYDELSKNTRLFLGAKYKAVKRFLSKVMYMTYLCMFLLYI